MARIQLALHVTDLDAAVDFYTTLFGTAPAKRRPGYANFAVEQPPLKLVLFEGGEGGTINHLGVEVEDTAQVLEAGARLVAAGLATDERTAETCCYATQDKVWVAGPDGERWEVYTVLDDAPAATASDPLEPSAAAPACCA